MDGIFLLIFGFLIGYLVARPAQRRASLPPEAPLRTPPARVMLDEIDTPAFAAIVETDQRECLRAHYQALLDLNPGVRGPGAPASPAVVAPPEPESARIRAIPEGRPAPAQTSH
jgi:hypothetical protein